MLCWESHLYHFVDKTWHTTTSHQSAAPVCWRRWNLFLNSKNVWQVIWSRGTSSFWTWIRGRSWTNEKYKLPFLGMSETQIWSVISNSSLPQPVFSIQKCSTAKFKSSPVFASIPSVGLDSWCSKNDQILSLWLKIEEFILFHQFVSLHEYSTWDPLFTHFNWFIGLRLVTITGCCE